MKYIQKRDVLLSVKTVYAELLVSGIKTIELRRRFPTELPVGTTIFIYSSGGPKTVIGKCTIDKIEKLKISELWKSTSQKSMISWGDFKDYFKGCEYGYAIYVKKPLRFDKPLELSQIDESKKISRPPQSFCYV